MKQSSRSQYIGTILGAVIALFIGVYSIYQKQPVFIVIPASARNTPLVAIGQAPENNLCILEEESDKQK